MKKYITGISALICMAVLLFSESCYSVRIASKHAIPEPNIMPEGEGYWRDKQVYTLDTTVKLKILESEATVLNLCPDGFHTIEYRVTLGHVLLSGITLGKTKKIKLKCNCVKPQ
jgi:hypothetical protein